MRAIMQKMALVVLVFLASGIASVHAEKSVSLPDFSDLKLY
jgi:hypothetical protein